VGWDDKPIDGLYVAGNSMARLETGAVMQSGVSNARGMIHGYLAARHAAGNPSPLLESDKARENAACYEGPPTHRVPHAEFNS
jgi:3-oxosteroid 1-dehydrogenase